MTDGELLAQWQVNHAAGMKVLLGCSMEHIGS